MPISDQIGTCRTTSARSRSYTRNSGHPRVKRFRHGRRDRGRLPA